MASGAGLFQHGAGEKRRGRGGKVCVCVCVVEMNDVLRVGGTLYLIHQCLCGCV